jgi:hypothetical protein
VHFHKKSLKNELISLLKKTISPDSAIFAAALKQNGDMLFLSNPLTYRLIHNDNSSVSKNIIKLKQTKYLFSRDFRILYEATKNEPLSNIILWGYLHSISEYDYFPKVTKDDNMLKQRPNYEEFQLLFNLIQDKSFHNLIDIIKMGAFFTNFIISFMPESLRSVYLNLRNRLAQKGFPPP